MVILGIESSCDETAAALVEDGRKILASAVFSQVAVHSKYGGVVPEIASRKHILKIIPVIDEAVKKAGIDLHDIDVVAVTNTPGLIGALLVGVAAAKGLAVALNKPLVAVNHLQAHLAAINLTEDRPQPPYIALLASGGHTQIYHYRDENAYEMVATTLDDAAGEAFDKISKLVGLGYPGGEIIEKTAQGGDAKRYKFPVVMPGKKIFNMSFSGLKTAAANIVRREDIASSEEKLRDFCASFQFAIVDTLVRKSLLVAADYKARQILVTGGVAANGALRREFTERAAKKRMQVWFPPVALCGDNAAMVAAAGYLKAVKNDYANAGFAAESRFAVKDGVSL